MARAQIPKPLAIAAGDTLLGLVMRILALLLAAVVISGYVFVRAPLYWQQLTSFVLLLGALALARFRPDLRLFLMILSASVSFRYLVWRSTHTLNFNTHTDAVLGLLLFGAEFYGILIMLLGYFQTVEELHRRPIPLPSNPKDLPWVDVYIPTFNESVAIVGRTVTGAMLMDYPKKRVYILDDGRRAEMRELAENIGCGYLTRADNKHAKAGNINAALKKTSGELVVIFDADHVPVRSFLQMTVGFFLQDDNLALVQTPHHFYNPDPFQRNLITQGRVPAEQELFYHVILVGDDFWNSAFFCGSCAVLRRTALADVGGIAEETVTEDAHTALKLHSRGWRSAYLAIPQAAGLATERYSFHVKQRMRWAKGMIQIMRTDNPLTKVGLTLPQRVNYFNAMVHFLFGIPRLIYVLAPLTYLLFGLRPISSDPWEILWYALPHILLAWFTNSITFRGFRHSFWAEVYEMAIAWQTAVVTTKTFFNPTEAKFNVTAKGEGPLDRPEFDWRNARPNLVLSALSLVGLAAGLVRYYYLPEEWGTIALNSAWTLFNLVILSAAILVALEQRQMRNEWRIRRALPALALGADGRWLKARTEDLSETGCRLHVFRADDTFEITAVRIVGTHDVQVELPVRCVHREPGGDALAMGLSFGAVDQKQYRALVQLIFSAADSWIDFRAPLDSVSRGFAEVIRSPFRVMAVLIRQAHRARMDRRAASG